MSWHRDFLNTKREEYREVDGGINYPRVTGSYEAMIASIAIYLEVYHPEAFQGVRERVMIPSLSNCP